MKFIFISFVVISSCAYFAICQNLQEGDLCTVEGASGVCLELRSCPWAQGKIHNWNFRKNIVRCGWKDSLEVVCCKNSKKPEPPKPIKKRISEVECDKIKNTRVPLILDDYIIEGQPVKIGEFPHMCAVGYEVEGYSHYDYRCGGTLISKDFVLSAAHCTKFKNDQPKVVRLGTASTDNNESNPSQDIEIEWIKRHPNYKATKKYNDVALFKLKSAAILSRHVKPACLYTKTALLPKTQELQITGWGIINKDNNERSKWMRKAIVKETPLSSCRESFDRLGRKATSMLAGIVESQMCASGDDGNKVSDACQGDSGGPLQFKTLREGSEQEDVFYIVGITSFGIGCGSNIPGVYTRVADFSNWIESVVWPQRTVSERFGESNEESSEVTYDEDQDSQEAASDETLLKADNEFFMLLNETLAK